MKKYFNIITVLATVCLLAVLMSSCGKYTVTNVRQFCPSPYYGTEGAVQVAMYNISDRKATAIADGTLYMTIDEGVYAEDAVDESEFEISSPDSFYLMKCGEEEWEKLAEAPMAQRNKDSYIPLVVNAEERIFAITDVEGGICVYEYVDEELVPNIFETSEYAGRGTHLAIGAEIRDGEGESGTIYMCFMNYTENSELHLLTYDIAAGEFSEDSVIATEEFIEGYNARLTEYTGSPQPYIFFPDESTVEIIQTGRFISGRFLIDTSVSSPRLLEHSAIGEKLENDGYIWGGNDISGADAVRLENGDIHIVTVAEKNYDDVYRTGYAHMIVRDGKVIKEEIFMPSSHNFVQLFVGVDGQAYMLMIQNEQEMIPEEQFGNDYQVGESNAYMNGVFYVLSEDGVEELGAVYVDGVPFVYGGFQLTADENKRIVYILYDGWYTANITTCEISY